MAGRRRVSAGVARRNERLTELRRLVPLDAAIVAVDLASERQAVVITDHDSRVLERRMVIGSPWKVAAALPWAQQVALEHGFASIVLACEPTGYRWKPLLQHARSEGLPLVCVNPMLVSRGREGEDFTKERSDHRDAVIIARLTSELRCYAPYQPEGPWARLRHLGVRRHQQLVVASAARQTVRDLLSCVWPSSLAAARKPLDSLTFRAVMTVSADPDMLAAMTLDEVRVRVKEPLTAWGGSRCNHTILRGLHDAAREPGGVMVERRASCERASSAMHDWLRARNELRDVERRMIETLDELGYTPLIDTVPGLSSVGAASILAETGDPLRFTHARAWVKHAGLCPRANESGAYRGQTRTSGRGRPRLRASAWRAIWGLLPNNTVYAARYAHLTTRARNPLNDGQARTALAAALLRQLHTMITTGEAWNPAIASGITDVRKAA